MKIGRGCRVKYTGGNDHLKNAEGTVRGWEMVQGGYIIRVHFDKLGRGETIRCWSTNLVRIPRSSAYKPSALEEL